jgi:soluble lytic murein transglycosylase-like protein
MFSVMPRLVRILVAALSATSLSVRAHEAAATESAQPLVDVICPLMEKEALENGLPPAFFMRLIWRESAFRPDVVSHKGAQGIAQFMPGTAKERGLENPFDPTEAIPHSARLLADLKRMFGNLGLAAAAYNAGPYRPKRGPMCSSSQATPRMPGRPRTALPMTRWWGPVRRMCRPPAASARRLCSMWLCPQG